MDAVQAGSHCVQDVDDSHAGLSQRTDQEPWVCAHTTIVVSASTDCSLNEHWTFETNCSLRRSHSLERDLLLFFTRHYFVNILSLDWKRFYSVAIRN